MKVISRVLSLRVLPLCIAFLLLLSSFAAAGAIPQDVGRRVEAATVLVHIEYDGPSESRISWGTGFVVGDGLIMTNAHVVSDGAPTRIYVHNAYLPATEARIVARRYDPDGTGPSDASYFDVALLAYTPPSGTRLPVLSFALQARQYQDVFAFGYPGRGQPEFDAPGRYGPRSVPRVPLSVTGGSINQIIAASPALIMHTALCAFGNSGGPLINSRGEVVGMQTWSADPEGRTASESFAIGSRGLVSFMQSSGVRPFVAR